VDAADLLGQLPVKRARRRGGLNRGQHDRCARARPGKELDEAEDGGRGEAGEHGERGQPPPADLAPPRLTAAATLVAVVEVRRNCHEGQDRSP
jgi:hypothetical protein